jgi:hypothetical protein
MVSHSSLEGVKQSCIFPCASCSVAHSDSEFIESRFVLGMFSKQMRISDTIGLKFNVINYMKEYSTSIRISKMYFGHIDNRPKKQLNLFVYKNDNFVSEKISSFM